MRKLIFISTLFLFVSSVISAQSEFRLGAKGGVNYASIGGDFTDNTRGVFGYHLGVLAEFTIIDKLSIQPELIFSTQGSENNTIATDGPKIVTKLDYLNLPLMAKYYLLNGFSITGGPQLGLLVSAKNEITPSGFNGGGGFQKNNLKKDISNFDFGLGVGVEYRIPIGVLMQLRYVFGLSNVNDTDGVALGYHYYSKDVKSHNNVLQLSVGYSF